MEVPHDELQDKIQEARKKYHDSLVTRYDTELPMEIKKFLYIAALLDPRFKKLKFDGDGMMKDSMRRRAEGWLKIEYNAGYAKKVFAPSAAAAGADASGGGQDGAGPSSAIAPPAPKRPKTSSSIVFAKRGASAQPADTSPTAGAEQGPFEDEMAEYLKLPQIEGEDDWAPLEWWCANKKRFPNLARMARQYLGCPATSATVERLFSAVGLAFSDQRKSSSADTLADIAFTKLNLD